MIFRVSGKTEMVMLPTLSSLWIRNYLQSLIPRDVALLRFMRFENEILISELPIVAFLVAIVGCSLKIHCTAFLFPAK